MANEKSLMEMLLLEAKSLDSTSSKESAMFKVLIEQFRFGQDCRKRALDAGQQEHHEWVCRNDGKVVQSGAEPNVIELADKYYNWLINIPQ